jgi:uncharacterized protein YggE
MVVAKIRQIDKTGSIIDTVAEDGGDLIRIDNISFSIDDPSQYRKEARDKAMADARAKAEEALRTANEALAMLKGLASRLLTQWETVVIILAVITAAVYFSVVVAFIGR